MGGREERGPKSRCIWWGKKTGRRGTKVGGGGRNVTASGTSAVGHNRVGETGSGRGRRNQKFTKGIPAHGQSQHKNNPTHRKKKPEKRKKKKPHTHKKIGGGLGVGGVGGGGGVGVGGGG